MHRPLLAETDFPETASSHTAPSEIVTLIEDARCVPIVRRRVVDLRDLPRQRATIRIPDASVQLVESSADYGV